MPILGGGGAGSGSGKLNNGLTILKSGVQPGPDWSTGQKLRASQLGPPAKVVVVALGGQSNNEGRGTTRDFAVDTDVSGIFQFVGYASDPNYRAIIPDITPLVSSNPYSGAGGYGSDRVGPGEYYARAVLAGDPGCYVVLVPCAVGGTTLSVNSPQWKSNATAGAGGVYFEDMISQTNLAVAAAQAKWGASIPIEVQLSWVQGEFDATFTTPATRSQYLADLTDVISRFRSRVTGASTAKVSIGSMIPYRWLEGGPFYDANYAAINQAHVDASLTLTDVYYVRGPGTATTGTTDGLHYSPEDVVRIQGTRNGAIVYDTVGPNVTNGATVGNTPGATLSVLLTHDDPYLHATFAITGGADSAQFEISDPYLNPTLRWVGNGTGPANGTYQVQVTARDGRGNLGTAKTFSVVVSNEVDPATFFTAGEPGGVYPLTLATMFQDIAGTIPVTAAGQVVGKILDTSPNGNHLVAAANDTTRPTYQVDSDGMGYLSFDGSNDLLKGAPYITATQGKNTVIMGFLAATPGSVRQPIGSYASGSAVPFMTWQCESTGILDPQMRNDAGNTGGTQPTLSGVFNSTKRIITHGFQGSNGVWRIRFAADRPSDGLASAGYSSVNQGTVSELRTGIDTMAIGGRYSAGAPSIWMACRIYPFFAIGRYLSDIEVKQGEEWVNNRINTTLLPGQTAPTGSSRKKYGYAFVMGV